MMGARDFSGVRRLVIKIGTSSLTDENFRLDERKVGKFVQDVMEVREGREILIVTSGAIGAGIGKLNLKGRPSKLDVLQAVAAVGQGILMQTYEKFFSDYGQPVAQLLLTAEDFSNPQRLSNLEATLQNLLSWGVIPIINENDTVATEEIKIGDNDLLAAHVAIHSKAQMLVILSDVDGLFTEDPRSNSNAKLVKVVERVSPELEEAASKSSKRFGGMYTKVIAAKMATSNGIFTVLANSAERDVLKRILDGEEIGTLFLPQR
jgi:glutamate 5-kinase